MSEKIVNPPVGRVINVGETIRVPWSNGAGVTLYKVEDPPGSEPTHVLRKVSEWEVPFNTVHRCMNTAGRAHWFVWPDYSSTAVLTRREADDAAARMVAEGVTVVDIARPVWHPSQTDAEYVAQLVAWLRVVPSDGDELETLEAWTRPLTKDASPSNRTLSNAQRAAYRKEFGMEYDRWTRTPDGRCTYCGAAESEPHFGGCEEV